MYGVVRLLLAVLLAMAFDMGWNFRATAGYVTDDAHYGVPGLSETYPHTYTNGDGQSVNGGWDVSVAALDLDNTNDARLAGINFATSGVVRTFTVDLASGSAPGAGDYAVDLACGNAVFSTPKVDFKLFDNATLLIDGTNGGAGFNPAADHYRDATLTDVAATSSWTGTPVTKTFASTTVIFGHGYDNIGDNWQVAHFRLTLQAGGAVAVPPMIALAPPTPAGFF